MATVADQIPAEGAPFVLQTVADLVRSLGDVPLERIRLQPAPGTATVADLLAADAQHDRLWELIDGTLVEKAMGHKESRLAAYLIYLLQAHVLPRKLGHIASPDGYIRRGENQVRAPDVAFTSSQRLSGGKWPDAPIPAVVPDLAVEILSAGNRPDEMQRKLRDYFAAGTRLVWYVDPATKTVEVFTAVELKQTLTESDTLTGGDVLPGFAVAVREFFEDVA
jgi:Uma2 family endonuclease